MLLAVEGPTVAGKSTLIKELESRVPDARLFHCGKPRGDTRLDVLREYVLDHEGYTPGKENLLFDRLSHGEVTYAPIYRPDSVSKDGFGLLGRAGWRWTELFLASRGAAIAMLTADNDTLAQRLQERGDDHVENVDDLMRISSLYEVARRESVTVAAIHNTSLSETTPEKYASFIDTFLEEAKRREEASQQILEVTRNYVGVTNPSALLVGDVRNIGAKHGELTQLPFLPIDGNSGDYLLSALPDLFWRGVGIINGGEVSDIGALWETLGKPAVVALGANAARQLDMSGGVDSYTQLPHPQYVRRFHNMRQREYGKAIQEAAVTGEGFFEWGQ